MKKLIFVSLFFALSSAAAPAPSLSDAGYLRKVSLHIRGVAPSTEEYAQLGSLKMAEDRAQFIQQKISAYLSSQEAEERMIFRLSELFQIRTPTISTLAYDKLPASKRNYIDSQSLFFRDSMTDIFARLSRDNLSWDYLLTGRDYNAFATYTYDGTDITDYSFFSTLFPNLPESQENPRGNQNNLSEPRPAPIPLHFEADDTRVSGVLTTPRFFSRYVTTNVNKNRRRAAAVFRIFLCDPMFPIIPPPPDRKGAILSNAFNDQLHVGVSEARLESMIKMGDAQRHGSDQRCVACHYKLDPMGRTFQNIGLALSPSPAPGKLTYARAADGQKFEVPLRGIGDLGKAIARQPEYVSCQIDWFWKEFIGSDVPLTPERKIDLMAKFENVGRRTNDFIRVLVTAPEFRMRPQVSDKISFAQVQPLLKRCDTCHSSVGDIPTFSDGKMGGHILLEMRRRLNLPDGSQDKMPRDWMKWDVKDLNVVKAWIEQGAVDSSGQAMLAPADLKGAK